MYINESERTLLAKLCYVGPAGAGKADLLRALYDHFAAQFGEHTLYESKSFATRSELEADLGKDGADKFTAAAEKAFSAPYDSLTESGTLIWMRTRLPGSAAAGSFHRSVGAFSAAGVAPQDALRQYCLTDADAVVFVADGREEGLDATLEAWSDLQQSGYSGPIVLLANHCDDADWLAEKLGVKGEAWSESGGFEGNLHAFNAAAKLATKSFRSMN